MPEGQTAQLPDCYTEAVADIIKTRFAPSPTGYLHVGGARTALFAWLWARHNQGEFHLRIEDTDRARLVEDAETQIIEALDWLGLDRDGPVIRQSERLEVYRKYAEQLVGQGRAKKVTEDKGEVIRFIWPEKTRRMSVPYLETGRGSLEREFDREATPSAFEEFVLIKSDGFPTYNFAHVVDDHEAGINCVIRGDEFISSLNKYAALYEAFDWPRPKYVHVPTILGPDKAKLSKRHGARDVLEYRAEGFLPQALANFIALIGWSPGGDRELFFSVEELVQAFDLQGLQKSPGVFDEQKLLWMNGEHMKNLDTAELLQAASRGGFWQLEDLDYDAKVVGLAGERAKTLRDLSAAKQGFYYHRPELTKDQLVGAENPETIAVWLERVQRELDGLPEAEWTAERLRAVLDDTRGDLDLQAKQLYPVLREALTGAPQTPALWDLMALFGKVETAARLEAAASLVS